MAVKVRVVERLNCFQLQEPSGRVVLQTQEFSGQARKDAYRAEQVWNLADALLTDVSAAVPLMGALHRALAAIGQAQEVPNRITLSVEQGVEIVEALGTSSHTYAPLLRTLLGCMVEDARKTQP